MRRKWNRSLGLLSSYYCSAFYNFPNLVEDLESSLLESQSYDFLHFLWQRRKYFYRQTEDSILSCWLLYMAFSFPTCCQHKKPSVVVHFLLYPLMLGALPLYCIVYHIKNAVDYDGFFVALFFASAPRPSTLCKCRPSFSLLLT